MAQVRCPERHEDGTASLVEVLVDRFRCLVCGTYFDHHGDKVDGGLVWTTPVPSTHAETARRDVAAFKTTQKRRRR